MLNSHFKRLSRQGWRGTPYNYKKRAQGCLHALYGGNTEAIGRQHGGCNLTPLRPSETRGGGGQGGGVWGTIKKRLYDAHTDNQ